VVPVVSAQHVQTTLCACLTGRRPSSLEHKRILSVSVRTATATRCLRPSLVAAWCACCNDHNTSRNMIAPKVGQHRMYERSRSTGSQVLRHCTVAQRQSVRPELLCQASCKDSPPGDTMPIPHAILQDLFKSLEQVLRWCVSPTIWHIVGDMHPVTGCCQSRDHNIGDPLGQLSLSSPTKFVQPH